MRVTVQKQLDFEWHDRLKPYVNESEIDKNYEFEITVRACFDVEYWPASAPNLDDPGSPEEWDIEPLTVELNGVEVSWGFLSDEQLQALHEGVADEYNR